MYEYCGNDINNKYDHKAYDTLCLQYNFSVFNGITFSKEMWWHEI